MDPTMKLVLDETQKSREEAARRFDDHDANWEKRFMEMESARSATHQRIVALESSGGTSTNPDYERRIAELEGLLIDSAPEGATLHPDLECRLNELERLHVEHVRGEENDRVANS